MPGSPPTDDSWTVFFSKGVLESWLERGYSEATRTAVRDWLWTFSTGPPADAGLVFGMSRSTYYDPEYLTARLNTGQGIIEVRFVAIIQDFGAGSQSRVVVSYLGPPPPVDALHPNR